MALNASFDGAKMVMSESELIPSTSPAFVNAPASDVSPVLMAVCADVAGTVRTVSIMCTTLPPSNSTSYNAFSQRFRLMIQGLEGHALQ